MISKTDSITVIEWPPRPRVRVRVMQYLAGGHGYCYWRDQEKHPVMTVGELTCRSEGELLLTANFGRVAVEYIKEVLASYGLCLRRSAIPWFDFCL